MDDALLLEVEEVFRQNGLSISDLYEDNSRLIELSPWVAKKSVIRKILKRDDRPHNFQEYISALLRILAPRLDFEIPPDAVFFEFPTREPNGCVIELNSGYAIFFNRGLFYLLGKYTHIETFRLFLRISSPDRFAQDSRFIGLTVSLIHLLLAQFGSLTTEKICSNKFIAEISQLKKWPSEIRSFRANKLQSMESFLNLHEKGQIWLGHVRHSGHEFRISPNEFASSFKLGHKLEFAADEFAIKAFFALFTAEEKRVSIEGYSKIKDTPLSELEFAQTERPLKAFLLEPLNGIVAIFELFCLFDLIEFTARKLKRRVRRTHPPAMQRLERIKNTLIEELRTNDLPIEFVDNHVYAVKEESRKIKEVLGEIIKERQFKFV